MVVHEGLLHDFYGSGSTLPVAYAWYEYTLFRNRAFELYKIGSAAGILTDYETTDPALALGDTFIP